MPWAERLNFALRQIIDRGRGLSGFLSKLSALGLILAVAVLLAVLSVMNGFEREMRDRILGLVPHVTVRGFTDLESWRGHQQKLAAMPEVTRSSLFAERDVLAVRGTRVHAARLLGLSEEAFSIWQPMITPPINSLPDGDILLGRALAERLGVDRGHRLQLIVPAANNRDTTANIQVVTVSGVIYSGTELDEGLMIGSFGFAASLESEEGTASGIALQLEDLFSAPRLRWTLAGVLPPTLYVTDWTGSHGNLYTAIQLSRDLITLLLLSIIAVAAFNVVSSLVLVVTDRRGSIAMLRALGASGADISWIFLLQGGLIGVIGASAGLFLGVLLAEATPYLAAGLEWLLDVKLLNTDVYPLSFLPVDVRWSDAVKLWCAAVLLCLVAAIVPARRAAKLPVAQILATQGA